MPIPNIKKKEKQSEYVSRCVQYIFKDGSLNNKDMDKNDEKDRKQAVAVCFSKWEQKDEDIVHSIDIMVMDTTITNNIATLDKRIIIKKKKKKKKDDIIKKLTKYYI